MQTGNDENAFVDRLTAWDDKLSAGSAANPADLEDTPRFVAACHMVQRLEALWPRTPPAATLELPAGFSRFRVVRVLGTGGFGIVYLAEDSRLKRLVALKLPRPEALAGSTWRDRFLREAHAVAQLSHPNIVPLFDSGEVGPCCFLVSAYCSGGSLADWLRTQRDLLPCRAVARLSATLADALQHAHERGILHRDLKPANILLTPALGACTGFPFEPHIADFGLAKIVQQAEGAESLPTLTQSTAILGTPAYMAPEQARGNGAAVGTPADLYALGVLLYELLTGQPPFRGSSHLETLQQIAAEDPMPLRRQRPEVPRDLEAICLKCLEKTPARRYASATHLAEDLRRFLDNKPTLARPLGLFGRTAKSMRRHPALAALSAVVAGTLLLIVGGLLWRSHELEGHNHELKAAAIRETDLAQKARLAQALAEERERRVRSQSYTTNLRMAANFTQENRRELAHELLSRQLPPTEHVDERDFAWRHLWHRNGAIVKRNNNRPVFCLTFNPDGRRLYTGDDLGGLQCFDIVGDKEMVRHQIATDLSRPPLWRFSAGAERLALFALEPGRTKLAIFETSSKRLLQQALFNVETHPASCFSPDGAHFVYCTIEVPDDPKVMSLDIKSGKTRTLVRKLGYRPWALAFSPTGHTLAVVLDVAGKNVDLPRCLIAMHSWQNDITAFIPVADNFREAMHLLWSPDGKTLACCSLTRSVVLWGVEPPHPARVLPTSKFPQVRLDFSPDGKHLAVLDSSALPESHTVRTFRVEDGRENPATFVSKAAVHSLAWSPSEDLIAIAGADKDIQLWRPLPAPAHQILRGHQPAETWSVAFAPDGKTLASAGDDWMLRLWDPFRGTTLGSRDGHTSLVTCVAYSPDGRWLATGSYDKDVVLRSATAPYTALERLKHPARVRCLAFSADGKLLASSSRERDDLVVRLWDPDTGKEIGQLAGHTNVLRALAFAPLGNLLASASNDGSVCLWDPTDRKLLRRLPHKDQVTALAFSPDGRTLVTGEVSGAVTFWNVAAGQAISTLQNHTECVRALAFSPDGRILASGSQDKTVRLWNPEVQQELFTFPIQNHEVNSVAFSPDSTYLAAGLHDGTIALWHGPRLGR